MNARPLGQRPKHCGLSVVLHCPDPALVGRHGPGVECEGHLISACSAQAEFTVTSTGDAWPLGYACPAHVAELAAPYHDQARVTPIPNGTLPEVVMAQLAAAHLASGVDHTHCALCQALSRDYERMYRDAREVAIMSGSRVAQPATLSP